MSRARAALPARLRGPSRRGALAVAVLATVGASLAGPGAAPFVGATRLLAQAPRMSATERLARFDEHRRKVATSRFGGVAWQYLGPTNVSGRVTDVAVAEPRGDTYTMYVGAAGGGVWKTVNEGVTWEPVFDDQVTASIGDVAIAPSDPDQVWVGTGEANIFRSSHAGAGVYKSTDAGASWTHMGLTETQTIGRIVVHPTDPDIVWVAASGHEYRDNPERGVFRTRDGGRSWEKVLYVDERAGAIDLVVHPTDPDVLYAATWQRRRSRFNDPRNEPAFTGSGAPFTGSGVWKSIDGGDRWTAVNEGLPQARFRGRIGLDIARSSPETLYAFVDNYEVAREAPPGAVDAYGRPRGGVIRGATVYRTDDGGAHWTRTSEHDAYMEAVSGTYGWVFGQIRVDPNDEDRVYLLGIALHVSDDGGRSFRAIDGIHVDQHGLYIDPRNSDYLVVNNDGGVYVSYDAGENWRFFEQIPVATFFNAAVDVRSPFRVYGSLQDHGSYSGVVDLGHGRQSIPAVAWQEAPGGEGSHHVIDPEDPEIVYSAGFYGALTRTDLSRGVTRSIMPRPEPGEPPLRGQWLAPFVLSTHDPATLYHGLNFVFRSRDRGDSWERISPDLSHDDPARLGDVQFQTVASLAESPLVRGLLYAGTDDGRVHVMRDSASAWVDVSDGLHPDRFVAEVVASAWDEGTVYVVQNGRRSDDFGAYVWRSEDYGASWESLAGDLPLGPLNVLREDPKNVDVLYAGSDVGVYVSTDRGASWEVLGGGLPGTFVHDLAIHPRDDLLVAATHGRGMFALDVRSVQRLGPAVADSAAYLFPPDDAFAGRSTAIHYWLAEDADVTLQIRDDRGEVLTTLDAVGRRGLHSVAWSPGDSTPAAEGRLRAVLIVAGVERSAPFEVVRP